jgi:hypothetical protein
MRLRAIQQDHFLVGDREIADQWLIWEFAHPRELSLSWQCLKKFIGLADKEMAILNESVTLCKRW